MNGERRKDEIAAALKLLAATYAETARQFEATLATLKRVLELEDPCSTDLLPATGACSAQAARESRRVKTLRRPQNARKLGVSRRQMIASPRLDFIRRHRILANFGAEHALSAPTLAHPAGLSLRLGEPTSATDY